LDRRSLECVACVSVLPVPRRGSCGLSPTYALKDLRSTSSRNWFYAGPAHLEMINRITISLDKAAEALGKKPPAAANDFITGYAINWGPVFASGVIIVLPVALAAPLLQRYIVRGITLGAFR